MTTQNPVGGNVPAGSYAHEAPPVETLRAAAARLREMAGAATPGPWEATTGRVYRNRDLRGVQRYPEMEWVAHYVAPADATLIALLGPTGHTLLAEWLDLEAYAIELTQDELGDHGSQESLALARHILGGA